MENNVKQGYLTELSWAVVLWLFRCFCVVWTVAVVLIAARAFVMFVE